MRKTKQVLHSAVDKRKVSPSVADDCIAALGQLSLHTNKLSHGDTKVVLSCM